MSMRKDHARVCSVRRVGYALSVALLLTIAHSAHAQWSGTFEPSAFVGNTTGIALNGQGGFFNPVPATSVSAEVYTYSGNTLGIPQNPTGETQFAASEGPAGSIHSRSQLAFPFDDGTGLWMTSFDILVTFTGTLPTAQNIGSFSTQENTDASFISLATWVDTNTAANWNADYVWYDSGGAQIQEQVPNPAFQNLEVNRWYRWTTLFDLDTNRIVEVAITDLSTGTTSRQLIASRYLTGGATGAPPPTGFRLFAGNSTEPGNTIAWDNIMVARPGALVIQDEHAWGWAIMQEILTDLALPYDMASSADLATIDLDRYHLVLISSNQDGNFYTEWNTNVARFENFVVDGGHLWLSTCAQADTVPEPLIPGGVISNTDLDNWNVLIDPDHRWVIGVPNPMYGSYASHDSFTNLYPGSWVVAVAQTSGQPTLVEYWMGAGSVFLTGQTLEITTDLEWDGAPIIENSLNDLMGWLVFSNGFDSGTTGGWSTTFP